MPTGYTAAIADGIDFNQFAMQCARAMGACVTMRDAPLDAPIPERFEPSNYHLLKLEELRCEMERLRTMSPAEADVCAQQAYSDASAKNAEAIERCRSLRSKYEAMLDSVNAWSPPTPEHVGLKDFMVQQLLESIKFDCGEDYYIRHALTQKTGEQWLADRVASVEKDLAYHTDEHAKEVQRAAARTAWVSALRDSLNA